MVEPTSKASYVASGLLTALGALSINEIATVIGIILAVGTFAVNWYYRRKMVVDTEDHHKKMRDIARDGDE